MLRRRVAGTLVIGLGAAGALISLLAVILLWSAWPGATARFQDSLTLTVEVLERGEGTLAAGADSLEASAQALRAAQLASREFAELLRLSQPTVRTTAILLSEEAPQSLRSVEEALPAFEETASVVDQTLRSLNPLSELFGLTPYQPEVPLPQAAVRLGAGLEGLPESMELAGRALRLSDRPLGESSRALEGLAVSLAGVESSIRTLAPLTRSYSELSGQLAEQTIVQQRGLARSLTLLKWLLTFILLWLGLSQIGLVQLGFHLLYDVPSERPEEARPGGP